MEEEIEKKQGLPLAQKLEMFSNRLTKVFKHRSKIARRTGVGCYRIYEHDLPEFPFCIEAYENKIYVSEYVRRHGMTDEEHDTWLQPSLDIAVYRHDSAYRASVVAFVKRINVG